MKKITYKIQLLLVYSLLILCFSVNPLNAKDTLREIIIRFYDGTPQDTIDAYLKEFNATELDKTPLTQMRLWRLNEQINIKGKALYLIGTDTLDIQESVKRARKKVKAQSAGLNHATYIPKWFDPESPPSISPFTCPLQLTSSTDRCTTVVAIIDSGVDQKHPYLQNWTWRKPFDFINKNISQYDLHGHGTHIAGTIIQMAMKGETKNLQIMPLRTQDKNGEGTVFDAIYAIDYAILNNANIINMSMGYWARRLSNNSKPAPLEYAINEAKLNDVLVIASAGNDGRNIDEKYSNYPAGFTCTNLISVAASDCQDELYDFSNYGRISVDLSAPGLVYSTVLEEKWDWKIGTSMATAIVSGAAGLLGTHTCDFDPYPIRDAILSSVDKVGLPIHKEGRLNADAALRYLLKTKYQSSTTSFSKKEKSRNITIYPIPFQDKLNVEWHQNKLEKVVITISDVLGRKHFYKTALYEKGQHNVQWDQPNAEAGLYYITLIQGSTVTTKKIIKRKNIN